MNNRNLKFKTLIRKAILLILFSFLTIFSSIIIKAEESEKQAQILFINQVRGDECCQKGSLGNLLLQIEAFKKNKIPAFFALRYDVLRDNEYVQYLKESISTNDKIIQLGLLLEITPKLAQDSGVEYRGNENNWFEAQNIYSIGYSKEENEKILNHLFLTFYNIFGFYPEITSAWMINTETLNYLTKNYGVKIHQVTKEQYNTDSYTLYGGPAHYPYPASEKWIFVPDYNRIDAPLIVRQTVTDPLYNYGDNKSNFTSQPNDYMRDKKDINYFQRLINQVVDKSQLNGFGLLGLENSMDEIYQKEYLLQIDYIKKLNNESKVIFPDPSELVNFWQKKKITIYTGTDLINNTDNYAYWINTPNYRVRLRMRNGRFFITDLRIYSQSYLDPYLTKVAQKEGFWIMPYLIDGSHWYKTKTDFDQKNFSNYYPIIRQDIDSDVGRLDISSFKKGTLVITNEKNKSIKFQFQDSFGKKKTIIFNDNSFVIEPTQQKDINYFNYLPVSHPIKTIDKPGSIRFAWQVNKKTSHFMNINFNKNQAKFSFGVDSTLLNAVRIEQYPFLFPEPISRKISIDKSLIIVHNRYALAGRNPIRLIVIPYDIYGIPSISKEIINVATDPSLTISENYDNKLNFVDISSDQPTKAITTIKIAGQLVKKEEIYFVPNCIKKLSICLTHPQYLWWYANTIFRDKIRFYLDKEKQ